MISDDFSGRVNLIFQFSGNNEFPWPIIKPYSKYPLYSNFLSSKEYPNMPIPKNETKSGSLNYLFFSFDNSIIKYYLIPWYIEILPSVYSKLLMKWAFMLQSILIYP